MLENNAVHPFPFTLYTPHEFFSQSIATNWRIPLSNMPLGVILSKSPKITRD